MRSLSVFGRLFRRERLVVERVWFDDSVGVLIIGVRAKVSASYRCPTCGVECPAYDRGGGRRRWRTLDHGGHRTFLEADAPRVRCADHGVVVATVPWARHDAGHTRAFDDKIVWQTRNMSRTAVCRLQRVSWRTVGRIIDRWIADADAVAGDRLNGLRRIGIDEVSYRRGHKYLTVVVNHTDRTVLWVGVGRSKAVLSQFFELLGPERCQQIALVTADGADWIFYAVTEFCPNAKICLDPFHIVVWAGKALDEIRRDVYATARKAGQTAVTKELKGAQYALWKRHEDLNAQQKAKLSRIQETNRPLYRAYLLKEQLRQVFAAGGEERVELLDDWLAWAARSQLKPFTELARRIRVHFRPDIVNTLVYRLSNGPIESVNTKIRLLTRIAFGFKSTDSLIALIKLHLGGYQPTLPYRT